MSEILKSSSEWAKVYYRETQRMIIDPDGWDRRNFDESWGEPITYDEFLRRAMWSTQGPLIHE